MRLPTFLRAIPTGFGLSMRRKPDPEPDDFSAEIDASEPDAPQAVKLAAMARIERGEYPPLRFKASDEIPEDPSGA